MLNVMQANITFANALFDRPETKRIVVHHTDSSPDTTVEQIHQWHLNRGWSGIGYHYVIKGDGSIWQGRPEGKQGAHAYDSATKQANTDGIGITLCGQFMQYAPTSAQMDSLTALIKNIQGRYNNVLQVVKHSDVCATSCPGSLFPWQDLITRLANPSQPDIITKALNAGLIAEPHNPADPATIEFVLQVGLNIKGGN